jgi:hypothetical protein
MSEVLAHVFEVFQQIFFWPGDTVLAWLLTHHPRLAVWLGVSATSYGGPFSAFISGLVGWGLFYGLCHLTLLVVQLQERWGTRRDNDGDEGRVPDRPKQKSLPCIPTARKEQHE